MANATHLKPKYFIALVIWAIIFLLLQSLLPVLFPPQLIRNQPNTATVWNFDGDLNLGGIRGLQKFTTDSEGFRVSQPIDYGKKAGNRLFTIGASTTACNFLDDHKTWAALLEKKLSPNTEVINAGVDATLSNHQAAMFRHIQRFQPDTVVFLMGVNDWVFHIKDSFEGRWNRLRRKTQLKHSPLVTQVRRLLNLSPIPTEDLSAFFVERINGRLDPYGVRDSLYRTAQYNFFPNEVSDTFSKSLDSIGDQCRSGKIRCIFLTQPTVYSKTMSRELERSLWMTPFHEPYTVSLDSVLHLQGLYNSYVSDFALRNGFEVFDLASTLAPTAENFVDDVHYTEAGAQRVAAALADYLTRKIKRRGPLLGTAPFSIP